MRDRASLSPAAFAGGSRFGYSLPDQRVVESDLSIADGCEQFIGALNKSAQWLLILAIAAAGLAMALPPTAPVALAVSSVAGKMGADFETVIIVRKFRDWAQNRLERRVDRPSPFISPLDAIYAELDEVVVPPLVWQAPSPAADIAL